MHMAPCSCHPPPRDMLADLLAAWGEQIVLCVWLDGSLPWVGMDGCLESGWPCRGVIGSWGIGRYRL